MTISNRFVKLAATILLILPIAAAQEYTIADMGTFAGGAVSQGNGINVLGQVAGYARFANFNAHGAIWSQSTGLIDLGSIPPLTNFSVAQAINSFGDVAGYSDYNSRTQYSHAVLWAHGSLRDLGTLPGGSSSQANSINDLNQIAGYSNGALISPHAFLWTKQGGMQDLGTLPGGYYSQGIAINIQGEVAGYSNAANGAWYGFVWNQANGMQKLPGEGGSANGINDLGEVVGGAGSHAILWHNDANHTAEDLGVVSGQDWSSAFAISDQDKVVGWSGYLAFIWTKEKGMQDLNLLIPADSGWQLTYATGINVGGQITGVGTINGEQHGFLLTPISH